MKRLQVRFRDKVSAKGDDNRGEGFHVIENKHNQNRTTKRIEFAKSFCEHDFPRPVPESPGQEAKPRRPGLFAGSHCDWLMQQVEISLILVTVFAPT